MEFEMLLLAAPFSFLFPAHHVIPAKAGICRPSALLHLFLKFNIAKSRVSECVLKKCGKQVGRQYYG
jgi:hypothetical protein